MAIYINWIIQVCFVLERSFLNKDSFLMTHHDTSGLLNMQTGPVPRKLRNGLLFRHLDINLTTGKLHDDVILQQLPESFGLLFSCAN